MTKAGLFSCEYRHILLSEKLFIYFTLKLSPQAKGLILVYLSCALNEFDLLNIILDYIAAVLLK